MTKGWKAFCDRCPKEIYDELVDHNAARRKMVDDGNLIFERSRKGNVLHYCSKECRDLHRGV